MSQTHAQRAQRITNTRQLTARQRVILDRVAESIAKNGYAPTMRELAESLDIKNMNAVQSHLLALRNKGYVAWEERRARTLRIVKLPDARVAAKAWTR